MRFLRMRPGHGEQLIAEGDPEVADEERALVEEFRRQLDEGMWAAVPTVNRSGRRQATMVRAFDEIPRDTDRVIFFPRAAGGGGGEWTEAPDGPRPRRHHDRRGRAALGDVHPVGRAPGGGPARPPRGAGR